MLALLGIAGSGPDGGGGGGGSDGMARVGRFPSDDEWRLCPFWEKEDEFRLTRRCVFCGDIVKVRVGSIETRRRRLSSPHVKTGIAVRSFAEGWFVVGAISLFDAESS